MHVDMAAARVAERQSGVVTRDQLIEVGASRDQITRWLRNGRLHRVFRGVYLLGHSVEAPFARERAALLAVGDGGVLSHRTAAVLWGLATRDARRDIDITRPGVARANRRGIRVHRGSLVRNDLTRLGGFPVTRAARTLLDFADDAESRELERAFDEALIQRRTSRTQLREIIDRSPGRHGAPRIAALLDRTAAPAFTRSGGERRLLALIRSGGLPQPEVNVRVHGYELDFFWRAQSVNVELDAWEVHRDRREADNARDAELQARGLLVIRVTGRELANQPDAVLVRLTRALYSAPRSAAGP